MEPNNGNGPNWAMQRRVEGLVNKHMADMALETLQQRLSAVSEEMNHLSDDISRREDIPKRGEDIPRRTNVNFSAEPLSDSYSAGIVGEKLMPDTSSESAAQRKIISLLLEIKEEQQRQWAVLKDLQARVQGQMCEEEVESLDMDLPLRTMEQLDETERHLEDAAAQKRMRRFRAKLGWSRTKEEFQKHQTAGGFVSCFKEDPCRKGGYAPSVCRCRKKMATVRAIQTRRQRSKTALQTICGIHVPKVSY
ncbi:uncharacterized protein si:dkey-187a12.4 isoform X2 [Electrophorus electricus]|uniref:uncharacterized protein si:dkey-187a12.4 isoform X2 n=1 Tax=Electrophorus electricus TaxID=8005 RepID=UPI000F0A25E1|nr:uncharacterized protein si:dkey-187a12.4 isoform X2 [Electrophorus electricus]